MPQQTHHGALPHPPEGKSPVTRALGVSVQELEQHGYTKITFRGIYSYHACALLHGSLTFLTLLCPHCTDVH